MDRKREEDAPRERHREPVREPEVRVGLHDRRRHAPPRRREHHRPGDVPAAAEDDVGAARRENPAAGGRRATREQDRANERRRRPTRQPGDPERVELVACVRNELRLDAIRRPGERHVHAAPAERLRHRERRQHVAGRSPGGDQAVKLALFRHDFRRC